MLSPGTHRLGPENATLSVRTGRAGAAAKAGHDLLIEVTVWEASIAVAEDPAAQPRLELAADPTSLRVREGTGGIQALGDDDVANIHQTIHDEVLERHAIVFRSTRADADSTVGRFHVEGELELYGNAAPIEFDLDLAEDGAVTASAVVTQSDWGMKPYSALFGALKVADEVEVTLTGQLEPPAA